MLEYRNIIKEILYHRSRLVLTIIAIAWGTFSISLMLSLGEGLKQSFAKSTYTNSFSTLIISSEQSSKKFMGRPIGTKLSLTLQDVQHLKQALPNLLNVIGLYKTIYKLQHKQKSSYASPFAVTPLFSNYHHIHIRPPSRFISHLDNQNYNRVIVLGSMTATTLFGKQNPLHQTVQVNKVPFTVIGVTKPKMQFSFSLGFDDASSWIPFNTYKAMSNSNTLSYIIAVVKPQSNPEKLSQQINTLLTTAHNMNPNDPTILNIVNSRASSKNILLVFTGLQIFLGIIGGVTLLVAGIGVANVMFASVKRATKMIGVKMALGAKRYHILCHYTIESLIISLFGGFIGILLTEAIISIINHIHYHSNFLTMLGNPKPILSTSLIGLVIFILSLIGFIAGILPAKKAASIQPAEALRYE